MNRIFFIFLFFCTQAFGQGKNSYFLQVPAEIPKVTVDDMIFLLEKSTGKDWELTGSNKNVSPGIVLKFGEHSSFTVKESFRLVSNGSNLLTITSTSKEGLVFGFYKHLRSLGFKFYLPGEPYSVIPSLSHPFGKAKDGFDKPFLQIRNFFGTGGYGTDNPDPDKSVEKEWEQWRLRNGFGNAYELAGHRGENFILENKEILRKNPSWLAQPLTGNSQTDQTIKLDYTNKEGLNFFVDWTLQSLTQKNFKLPPRNHTELVSIEPSDGGGYLNHLPNKNNRKLPSVSDQVYGAANLAAQKLDKLFPNHPNIGVNLYAYSEHATPPSFPLHPRVFVQLIPYQFQNVAFGPSFIKLWSEKARRFGLYDYYNYTDAQYDIPGGLTLKEAMQRLIHSVQNGSEGVHYETSFSKFATGIPLYILNRYMSDGESNWQENLNILVKDLYPKTSENINRLFTLFYNYPQFSQGQLGNAVSLLGQIQDKQLDKQELIRINELKQYLQFIHLVYRSRDESKGEYKERMLPLAQYAWQIYDSKIVHSYRIMQLVSYAFLNRPQTDKNYPSFYQLHLDWFPETERKKTKWNQIPQGYSESQVNADFSSLKKIYTETSVTPQLNLSTAWNELQKNFESKKTAVMGGSSLNRGFFSIYSPQKTEIKIKYKVSGTSTTPLFTISGIDYDYSTPITHSSDKKEGEFKASLPAGATNFFLNISAGQTYRVEVSIEKGMIYFNSSPRGVINFYKSLDEDIGNYTYDPRYYPSFIYVPKDLPSVDYRVQLNALKLSPPSGTEKSSKILKTESDFEIRRIEVSKNESGQFWKARIGNNYNYNMMNLPDVYFLLKEK